MTQVSCTDVRELMLSARQGTLASAQQDEVSAHLAACAACTQANAADAVLGEALSRLPRYAAPAALKNRLAAQLQSVPPGLSLLTRRSWGKRLAQAAGGLALTAAIAATTLLVVRTQDRSNTLFDEAVNDHLRMLYSEHPIEIESGGIHQVKPWFAGKVDFAPAVPFGGDADFPLHGGSVAYFVDRKAAAFVFSRRLHTITLFVFRADGLPWPIRGGEELGARHVHFRTPRGFRVLLWRDGDLGYALVSDVNPTDLRDLAKRIGGSP